MRSHGSPNSGLDLAHTIMKTVGRLYKVLPTALVAKGLAELGASHVQRIVAEETIRRQEASEQEG